MIIATHYRCRMIKGRIHVINLDTPVCPCCGTELKAHGTCTRKAKCPSPNGCSLLTRIFHLRVLYCPACGKTHREIPDILIPYKRFFAALIIQITEEPDPPFDDITVYRARRWLRRFMSYAHSLVSTVSAGGRLYNKVISLVAAVVNSGFWNVALFGRAS